MKSIDGFDVTAVYDGAGDVTVKYEGGSHVTTEYNEEQPVTAQYSSKDYEFSREEDAFDEVPINQVS